MTRKNDLQVEVENKSQEIAQRILENTGGDVHHMTRRIGHGIDTVSGEQVDFDLRVWLAAGYRLHTAHYIGSEPNAINMLYILVRE